MPTLTASTTGKDAATADTAFTLRVVQGGAAKKQDCAEDVASLLQAADAAAMRTVLNVVGITGTQTVTGRKIFNELRVQADDQGLTHIEAGGNLRWSNGIRIDYTANDDYAIVNENTLTLEAYFSSSTGGFVVGAPTGGAKGLGSINAVSVYDDNSVLSCFVFDAALDGEISDKKWDAKVPDRIWPARYENVKVGTDKDGNDKTEMQEVAPARTEPRQHDPMRKFRARLGTEYDPLTLEGYAKHWKEKRHLTAMPNEEKFDPEAGLSTGEWVQRLIETVEIQAVLIDKLHERLKVVESA